MVTVKVTFHMSQKEHLGLERSNKFHLDKTSYFCPLTGEERYSNPSRGEGTFSSTF